MTQRLLIVEDNPDVANLLVGGLEDLVDRIDHALDGPSGLAMTKTADYALILLDLVLPQLGGAKFCELLRSAGSECPILAVTARVDLVAPVLGIRQGIDDYVLEPFDIEEVRRRSDRLLERSRLRARCSSVAEPVPELPGLTFDPAGNRVLLDGKPAERLSPQEFDMVRFLARNPGVFFSRSELLAAVWGVHHPVNFQCIGIDLPRLRKKLQRSSSQESCLIASSDDRYGVVLPAHAVLTQAA